MKTLLTIIIAIAVITQFANAQNMLCVNICETTQADLTKVSDNLSTKKDDTIVRTRVYRNVFDTSKSIIYAEIQGCQCCISTSQFALSKASPKKYKIYPQADSETMLVIAVDFNIKPEQIDEFLKISKPLVEGTNTEKDTLSYQLYRDVKDPTKFFLFELYKSRSAHKFHSSQEHFLKWNALCKEKKIVRTAKFFDVKEIK
jgi:autoinducer 2-degrading protein